MAQKKDSFGRALLSAGVKTCNDLIKRSKKFNNTTRTVILVFLLMFGTAVLTKSIVQAEQSGSSPESGATSRLKSLHDDLLASSYGSDTDSPDWGSLWNRIKTAAKWAPDCATTVNDVKSGKTFYCGSRAQQTGTYHSPGVCSTQQYPDDNGNQTDNCTNNYTWTTPSPSVTGDDKMDPQTGLIWSQALYNNGGTVMFIAAGSATSWNHNGGLTFYLGSYSGATTYVKGDTYTTNGQTFTVAMDTSYTYYLPATGSGSSLPPTSGTLTKTSGTGPDTVTYTNIYGATDNFLVGGKSASQLCTERGNGWRLPAEKELMQAYIDGSKFNLTLASNPFIPSTVNDSSAVYYYAVNLANGGSINYSDTYNSAYIRCVRQP